MNRTALLLLAPVALLASSARAEDFRWSGRVAPGQTLEIKGVNGAIEASPAAGGEIEVSAVKTARRSNPAEVEVKVVEHSGGVTICAVYPSSSWWGGRNECAPGDGGHLGANNNDVQVNFTVKVPAGIRFDGSTVNGAIKADRLPDDARVETVNGGIEVTAAGHVEAQTVNGSIEASLGRADWTGKLELQTVNGGITVQMPEGASTEIDAETVNGSIRTDFEVGGKRQSRRHLAGTIGSGGRRLEMETVNGSIEILKSR